MLWTSAARALTLCFLDATLCADLLVSITNCSFLRLAQTNCATVFKLHSLPISLSENCSLLGTDNASRQISEHIFALYEGYWLYIVMFLSVSISIVGILILGSFPFS